MGGQLGAIILNGTFYYRSPKYRINLMLLAAVLQVLTVWGDALVKSFKQSQI